MAIEITNWLRGLGLEQFATAFLANDIDSEVLPELTADDLIGLGVTSIGHRRKLLAAIATLGTDVPAAPRETRTPADAERRRLTGMFFDLTGSRALPPPLDPHALPALPAP